MDDKQLRQHVIDALDWDPSVDSAQIGVAVANGVAILTGHVPSYVQKQTANRITRNVKGVRAIADEMEVRFTGSNATPDEEIASRAMRLIDWDVTVPPGAVKVKVSKGWVSLSGEVEWDYQRRAAEADVRKLGGVVGVTNEVMLKPKPVPANISKRIREALERDADLEAERIHVSVVGGKVRLDGSARNWRERDLIERAAWAAPGVKAVDDHVEIGR